MLLFSHKIDFGGFVKSSTGLTILIPAVILLLIIFFSIFEQPAIVVYLLLFFYDTNFLLYILWKQIIEFINM